jgi:hypothetical protein
MERSHPSSGRSATPADINRNGRPTSIGTGGRHHSECPAGIIGIRSGGAREPTFRPSIGADLDFAEAMVAVLSQFVLQSQPPAAT